MSTDIVPFGKYKGRPIVDLIADRSYCEWLAAQPWFRERFTNVYNLIINTGGEPQDTPEHNKMQARYLDHDACLTLARPWLLAPDAARARWDELYGTRLTVRQRDNLQTAPFVAEVTRLMFEARGWDLLVRASAYLPVRELAPAGPCECRCKPEHCNPRTITHFDKNADVGNQYRHEPVPITDDPREWSQCYPLGVHRSLHCADDCPATWSSDYRATVYDDAKCGTGNDVTVGVELKPVIGDDYPSVLRTVVKRGAADRAAYRHLDVALVVADQVETEGVDLDAVRRIFRSQGIMLRTSAELPAPAPEWRCQCESCVTGEE